MFPQLVFAAVVTRALAANTSASPTLLTDLNLISQHWGMVHLCQVGAYDTNTTFRTNLTLP